MKIVHINLDEALVRLIQRGKVRPSTLAMLANVVPPPDAACEDPDGHRRLYGAREQSWREPRPPAGTCGWCEQPVAGVQ